MITFFSFFELFSSLIFSKSSKQFSCVILLLELALPAQFILKYLIKFLKYSSSLILLFFNEIFLLLELIELIVVSLFEIFG